MAVTIPYRRKLDYEYARCDAVAPNVRRVICENPSAFTFVGTGTYILGQGEVAVIDPGPVDPAHIQAIVAATAGETITHILITHTHMDHSPGTPLLLEHCDAKTYGYGPHGAGKIAEGVQVEEGGDMDFSPDVAVRHGDVIDGGSFRVECVYTPGHTSNHVCFKLLDDGPLFTGDHVMGWSTSIISPPDGDMKNYMESLDLLLERDDDVYWPTHGPAIIDPQSHVRAFIAHRQEREQQILDALSNGFERIHDMVPSMYQDVGEHLYPAAGRSVFASMQYLVERGVVECEGELALDARFTLST